MTRKKRKPPNKQMYDIVGWQSPFDYNEHSNVDIDTCRWMCLNKIHECQLNERGGTISFVLLVDEETKDSLIDIGYIIINAYGQWYSLHDSNIDIIHPETNKKIKPIKLFGGL